MENRFGFKDFLLCGLLLLVIVMLALAMLQFDRQWEAVQQIKKGVDQQQADLYQLQKMIKGGAAAQAAPAAAQAAAADATDDPFADLRKVYAAPDFAYGDNYTGAVPTVVKKLTPLVSHDLYSQIIASYVQESLINRDPETLEWKPYIARKWTISPDGLTLSFDLRQDAAFSDGSPLTADDVVFSFNQVRRSDIQCPHLKPYYEKFSACQAEGPYRVVFRLSGPYFKALEMVSSLPVLSKQWYEKISATDFNNKPGLLFGSGPYMLEGDPLTWTPASGQITLVRNPKYWGPKPPLDRLTWREYPVDTARLADFRNGKLDTYGVYPDVFPKLSQDAQLLGRGTLHRKVQVDDGYSYIGWNEVWEGKPSPFADRRVRQALTLLTDRARILHELNNDIGQVASGPFSPATHQPDPATKPWPFDPQRAKALLKEAGWEDRNGDGVLEDAKGRELRFKLTYPSGVPMVDRQMLFLKDAYAKAGIIMTPDPIAFDILIERLNTRDFQACSLAWGGSVEDDPRQIFHSESIKDAGDNMVAYSNPELDRLIDAARTEVDEAKRNEMWHKVDRILHEDQPYTFLLNREAVVFVDKRFRNYDIPKTGYANWPAIYVPAAQQKRQ